MSQCRKRCFTLEEAQEALFLAMSSKSSRRKEKRIYYCTQHNAYHLTSHSRIVRRNRGVNCG